MSRVKSSRSGNLEAPYFSSLKELDAWAAGPANQKLEGILGYTSRPASNDSRNAGKLLVCHDYKGGYTESPSTLSYTFNFWSSCDTFVYFSHHRVTIPPPGWITAAHRQGVKMLGTLIFEGGGEEDCLRLLVGNLPTSPNGPAKSSPRKTSLPLSPHYAKLLAKLAWQRGFDGYLLNFECPLQGGLEQCRTLAAWITVLQAEILATVGSHGETIWYDSVIFNGQLAWQDRLNSLNLPFFLSSSGLFSNYTWRSEYPNATAEYFLALDPALTGNASDSHPHVHKKSLNDIYMGVDVWGRGSHGGGGFGSYKALTHIAPQSLGLSVALFGQAWTWESEQDKPGWSWEQWWNYERKLWVGPAPGETIVVPEAPRREGEPECPHGPFEFIASFFSRFTPPDPFDLPLHTTFSPGVGHAWFVNGVQVHQAANGWTDVDKQTTVGDMVWPRPLVEWEAGDRDEAVPEVAPTICFEDAWNAGSSLKLELSFLASEAEDAMFRCIWIPVQSVAVTKSRRYEATIIYKADSSAGAELDIGLSLRLASGDSTSLEIPPTPTTDSELPGSWSKLTVQFSVPHDTDAPNTTGALGLIVAIVTEDPSQPVDITLRLGQLNVSALLPQAAAVHTPTILWADFSAEDARGILRWEVAAAFPPLTSINIKTPDDPMSAWAIHPSNAWLPGYVYFNIYAILFTRDGRVGQPEQATWIGTTGWDGQRNRFEVSLGDLPFAPEDGGGRVRFFVQGVTDRGVVLPWEDCIFVDGDLASIA